MNTLDMTLDELHAERERTRDVYDSVMYPKAKKDWNKVTDWCIERIAQPKKFPEFTRHLELMHEIWLLEGSELLRNNRAMCRSSSPV
jgi:hypothetical protein